MKREYFKELIARKGKTRKWITFPISLICHLAVVGLLVITPLLTADSDLPVINITDIALIQPATPPVQSGGKGTQEPTTRPIDEDRGEAREEGTESENIFVPPPEIPDEIDEGLEYDTGPPGESVVDGAPEYGEWHEGNDPTWKRPPLPPEMKIKPVRVRPPSLIKQVNPVYPESGRISRLESDVVVEAVTDVFGRVLTAQAVSGHPLFYNEALRAVRQWIYEPYIINGTPRPVKFTVTVKFRLQR